MYLGAAQPNRRLSSKVKPQVAGTSLEVIREITRLGTHMRALRYLDRDESLGQNQGRSKPQVPPSPSTHSPAESYFLHTIHAAKRLDCARFCTCYAGEKRDLRTKPRIKICGISRSRGMKPPVKWGFHAEHSVSPWGRARTQDISCSVIFSPFSVSPWGRGRTQDHDGKGNPRRLLRCDIDGATIWQAEQ